MSPLARAAVWSDGGVGSGDLLFFEFLFKALVGLFHDGRHIEGSLDIGDAYLVHFGSSCFLGSFVAAATGSQGSDSQGTASQHNRKFFLQ